MDILTMNSENPLKKITTAEGNEEILQDGFKYKKGYVFSTANILWECVRLECEACVRTNEEVTEVIDSMGKHTHPKLPPRNRKRMLCRTHAGHKEDLLKRSVSAQDLFPESKGYERKDECHQVTSHEPQRETRPFINLEKTPEELLADVIDRYYNATVSASEKSKKSMEASRAADIRCGRKGDDRGDSSDKAEGQISTENQPVYFAERSRTVMETSFVSDKSCERRDDDRAVTLDESQGNITAVNEPLDNAKKRWLVSIDKPDLETKQKLYKSMSARFDMGSQRGGSSLQSSASRKDSSYYENDSHRKEFMNAEVQTENLTGSSGSLVEDETQHAINKCVELAQTILNRVKELSRLREMERQSCSEKDLGAVSHRTEDDDSNAIEEKLFEACRVSESSPVTTVTTIFMSSSSSSMPEPERPTSKESQIILVGDSLGSGLKRILVEILEPSFCVRSYVYPKSTMETIFRNNFDFLKEERLTKNDLVVILAGSDDLNARPYKVTGQYIISAYTRFVCMLKRTNVILSNISYRHDLPDSILTNDVIRKTNWHISNLVSSHDNAQFLDLLSFPRSCYSSSGYLLNQRGRRLTALRIMDMFNDMNLPVHRRRFQTSPQSEFICTNDFKFIKSPIVDTHRVVITTDTTEGNPGGIQRRQRNITQV